jgi:hypothetical protein
MERNLARYPDAYQVIRYETLVSEPERTLTDICRFLGGSFSTQIVADSEDALNSKGTSNYESTDGGVVEHKATSNCDVAFIQRYAGRRMRALGYPLRRLEMSLVQKLLSSRVQWLANRASMVAWRPNARVPSLNHESHEL